MAEPSVDKYQPKWHVHVDFQERRVLLIERDGSASGTQTLSITDAYRLGQALTRAADALSGDR